MFDRTPLEADKEYSAESIENSAFLNASNGAQPTTTISGYQVNGYILLPWRWTFLTIWKS